MSFCQPKGSQNSNSRIAITIDQHRNKADFFLKDMLPTPYVQCKEYDKVYEPAEDSFLLLDSLETEIPFLQKQFKNEQKPNYVPFVVELGCGSGILSTFMLQNSIPSLNSLYFPIDVNPHALEVTKNTIDYNLSMEEKSANGNLGNSTTKPHQSSAVPHIYSTLQMDLFFGFRPKTIDVLVFNPPYVPAEYVPKIPDSKQVFKDQNTQREADLIETNDDVWLDLALLGGPQGMDITVKVLENMDKMLTCDGVAYILFCARNKPEQVAQEWTNKGWKVELVEKRKAGWEVLSVYKFTR
ncbi:hypothetical protein ACO0RG_002558 [Hanseniaspora osmophila]